MIAELKNVITKVEQLDNEEQKKIAKLINEEIKWDATLKSSEEHLYQLAQEAVQEHKRGNTQKNDW